MSFLLFPLETVLSRQPSISSLTPSLQTAASNAPSTMPPQDPSNIETLCGFKVELGKLSRGTWTWTDGVINGVILLDGVAFAVLSSHHCLPVLANCTWKPEDYEHPLSYYMPPQPLGHREWPSPDHTGTYHINTPFDSTSQEAPWADQDLLGQVFNQSIEAEVQFAIKIKEKQYDLDFVRTSSEYLHTIERGNRLFVNQNYDWALVELDPTDFPAGSACLVNRYHDRFSETVDDMQPITTLAPPPEDRISDISTLLTWRGSRLANRSIHNWGVPRMAMRRPAHGHARHASRPCRHPAALSHPRLHDRPPSRRLGRRSGWLPSWRHCRHLRPSQSWFLQRRAGPVL